jgi:hypothetical protein
MVYERAIVEGIGKEFDLFQSGAERSATSTQKVAARVQ